MSGLIDIPGFPFGSATCMTKRPSDLLGQSGRCRIVKQSGEHAWLIVVDLVEEPWTAILRTRVPQPYEVGQEVDVWCFDINHLGRLVLFSDSTFGLYPISDLIVQRYRAACDNLEEALKQNAPSQLRSESLTMFKQIFDCLARRNRPEWYLLWIVFRQPKKDWSVSASDAVGDLSGVLKEDQPTWVNAFFAAIQKLRIERRLDLVKPALARIAKSNVAQRLRDHPHLVVTARIKARLEKGDLGGAIKHSRKFGLTLRDLEPIGQLRSEHLLDTFGCAPVLNAIHQGELDAPEPLTSILLRLHSEGDHSQFLRQVLKFSVVSPDLARGVRSSLRSLHEQGYESEASVLRDKLKETGILKEHELLSVESSELDSKPSLVTPESSMLCTVVLATPLVLVPNLAWAKSCCQCLRETAFCYVPASPYWMYYRDPWDDGVERAWRKAEADPETLHLLVIDAIDRSIVSLWARPFFLLAAGVIDTLPGGETWPTNLRLLGTVEQAPHGLGFDDESASSFSAAGSMEPTADQDSGAVAEGAAVVTDWRSVAPKQVTGCTLHRRAMLRETWSRLLPGRCDSLLEHRIEDVVEKWPHSYCYRRPS